MGHGLSYLTFSHTQGQMVQSPFACDCANSATLIHDTIRLHSYSRLSEVAAKIAM